MEQEPKTLYVLSGGLDSTVALAVAMTHLAEDEKHRIETITFNYGSKHNDRENAAAKQIADHFGVKNTLVRLPFVNELFKSDLLKSGGEIPEGHYADPSMKRTVVPFRNGIMLAIAAGFAESIGAKMIVLGNHAGDHAIYPDCREEFTKPMSEAITKGTYAEITISRPFEKSTKTDIAKFGSEVGAPMHLTYSCYKGGEKHCGLCGTCYERKEAFRDAQVIDLTSYEA